MLTKHFERTPFCNLPFSNIERGKGGFDNILRGLWNNNLMWHATELHRDWCVHGKHVSTETLKKKEKFNIHRFEKTPQKPGLNRVKTIEPISCVNWGVCVVWLSTCHEVVMLLQSNPWAVSVLSRLRVTRRLGPGRVVLYCLPFSLSVFSIRYRRIFRCKHCQACNKFLNYEPLASSCPCSKN